MRKFSILMLVLVMAISLTSTVFADPIPHNSVYEGEGTYWITGEAYPSNIAMTGYNVKEENMYFNIDLFSTVVGTTSFDYSITLYNNVGEAFAAPKTGVTPAIGSAGHVRGDDGKFENVAALTASYRAVVIVTDIAN